MDKPLSRWYCDTCSDLIEPVNRGYVIWKSTDEMKAVDFKIIHQGQCDQDGYGCSQALEDFLGEKGINHLLSFLSIGLVKKNLGQSSALHGVGSLDEFVDFFRRVQTPYYEEARNNFKKPEFLDDFHDANEIAPYFPDELKKIVARYKD